MESSQENAQSSRIDKSFYKKLTRKISIVNKRMLNEEIQLGSLEKLEKEALRGAQTERSEAKPVKKSLNKSSFLSLILKSEHKIDSSTCIVKLPKMPFGQHKSYNNEDRFVLTHFINTKKPLNLSQADDLCDITKKFRLQKKQNISLTRNHTGNQRERYSRNYEKYSMDHGELYCDKNKEVVEGYVKDKEMYRKYLYQAPESVKNSRKGISKTDQEMSVERLHSFKQNDSHLASFFTSKYSRLFSKESGNLKVPNFELNLNL